METYELTYIIPSQYGAEESEETVNNILSAIKNKEGMVLKSEKTSPQTISYPIKSHSSGYFVTTEFQIAKDKAQELSKVLKDKRIIRSLLLVKKPVKPLRGNRIPPFRPHLMSQEVKFGQPEIKDKKVDPETIEKKLDEILGE